MGSVSQAELPAIQQYEGHAVLCSTRSSRADQIPALVAGLLRHMLSCTLRTDTSARRFLPLQGLMGGLMEAAGVTLTRHERRITDQRTVLLAAVLK